MNSRRSPAELREILRQSNQIEAFRVWSRTAFDASRTIEGTWYWINSRVRSMNVEEKR